MAKFQVNYTGENRELSFVCNHCAVGNESLTYDTYNRPIISGQMRQAGECPSCEGTGFTLGSTTELCPECEGTSTCSVCGGHSTRSWLELPRKTRQRWRARWERKGNYPSHYSALASFYRNW